MIKQNAIITGASGFLGSVFIKALLDLEFNLILVACLLYLSITLLLTKL